MPPFCCSTSGPIVAKNDPVISDPQQKGTLRSLALLLSARDALPRDEATAAPENATAQPVQADHFAGLLSWGCERVGAER